MKNIFLIAIAFSLALANCKKVLPEKEEENEMLIIENTFIYEDDTLDIDEAYQISYMDANWDQAKYVFIFKNKEVGLNGRPDNWFSKKGDLMRIELYSSKRGLREGDYIIDGKYPYQGWIWVFRDFDFDQFKESDMRIPHGIVTVKYEGDNLNLKLKYTPFPEGGISFLGKPKRIVDKDRIFY
ncbi:hypothetical protein GVN16_07700 [Emticicia sp. CRIBPO]|uniref:hypothetical protein n=1 Tax=Emticicia sp. CRIBPO TaxID=2683258 RepID=UPI001412A32C|nr:hypothetical protein [Emticicia sp. CRIBPO]NBA85637.1 hypothetical protein [Emticicia sp. CRIBPO]